MTDRDPFVGGCQTAQDRKLRINALNEADVLIVLARPDLQASVQRHAEDRLRRLRATEQRRIQAVRGTP